MRHMEKYRMRPIKSGKNTRMSYANKQEVLEMPNLIGVQVDSYKWFLEEGLEEAFKDISPITDFTGKLSLEFVDYRLFEEDKKYTIEECKERDATYSAPLKVNVRLINNETGEINQHEVFMGDMPLMTETGTLSLTVLNVLSSASLFVPLVYIILSAVIRPVRSSFHVRLYLTEVHGLSMRQMQMTYSMLR